MDIIEILKKGYLSKRNKEQEKEFLFFVSDYRQKLGRDYCTCKAKKMYKELIEYYKKAGLWIE